jgi:hypothetical protein
VSHRIEQVWAYVSVDPDGDEGVCGAAIGPEGSWLPLIGSDETRIKQLMPLAQEIMAVTGMRIKLIKLSVREDIMEVGGQRQ